MTGMSCALSTPHACILSTMSVYNHLHIHSQDFICITEEKTELRMAEIRTRSQYKHPLYRGMTTLHRCSICLNFFLLENRLMIESGHSPDIVISVYRVLNCSYFRV